MLDYEVLYDRLATAVSIEEKLVGAGDFELIGAIELDALRSAGLQAADTLLARTAIGIHVSRTAIEGGDDLPLLPFLDRDCLFSAAIAANAAG